MDRCLDQLNPLRMYKNAPMVVDGKAFRASQSLKTVRLMYDDLKSFVAQDIGLRSRDLLRLTGARVDLVQQCAGIDGMWGLRAGNEDLSVPIAEQLGEQIEQAGGAPIAGDCHLANTAIREQTGRRALHPLQILARAYGIPDAP